MYALCTLVCSQLLSQLGWGALSDSVGFPTVIRKEVIGLTFDPIAEATARAAQLDETLPSNGQIVEITENARNPFNGLITSAVDGSVNKVKGVLLTKDLLLVEASLHTQKVANGKNAGNDQFVLNFTCYLSGGKLQFAGPSNDGSDDIDFPLPGRVAGQMLSFSGQKMSCSEEVGMEFGLMLEKELGLKEPETLEKNREGSKIVRVWTLAVPVPNETKMRRANIIAQRIERAKLGGPNIKMMQVGENYTEEKGGYRDFFWNFTESLALATNMAGDSDEERKREAGTLISSITGRKESAPVVQDDGSRKVPVHPVRADVGRLQMRGSTKVWDFWGNAS